MLDALHVECTHLYKYVDEFWLHVITAVSCDLELLNYQWLWCRALARELSDLCFGPWTSVVAKEYNKDCMANTQRVCQSVSDNPKFKTACSTVPITTCGRTLDYHHTKTMWPQRVTRLVVKYTAKLCSHNDVHVKL
jgi:hypothetical protein